MVENPTGFGFTDCFASILDFDFLSGLNIHSHHRPDQVAVFGYLHCLPSLTYLIGALKRIGIPSHQIYLLGKPYSTIPTAVEALRALGVSVLDRDVTFRPGFYDEAANALLETVVETVCRRIIAQPRLRRVIIVDDGGLLTAAWWRKARALGLEVVSVQQTTSGFRRNRLQRSPFPKIDVARCAAKRIFEAQIIVDGVLAKVKSNLASLGESRSVAVIGVGAVGSRLAEVLRDLGKDVWVHDRARTRPIPGVQHTENWRRCIRYAQVVFGCTGANWLDLMQLGTPLADPVSFISCSSRDVEFRNLLQTWSGLNKDVGPRFAPLRLVAPTGIVCEIANWGFPINFDRATEWEAERDIALTRALIFGGILQALASDASGSVERVESMSAEVQYTLVDAWLDWQGKLPKDFGVSQAEFDNMSWWQAHSVPTDDNIGSQVNI